METSPLLPIFALNLIKINSMNEEELDQICPIVDEIWMDETTRVFPNAMYHDRVGDRCFFRCNGATKGFSFVAPNAEIESLVIGKSYAIKLQDNEIERSEYCRPSRF